MTSPFANLPMVPQGIDRDFPGPLARGTMSDIERAAFNEVRERLDRPLQIAGITPLQPQLRHTPQSYESDLLAVIAQHSEKFKSFDAEHGPLLRKYSAQIIADAAQEPARQGRLAEVVTTDRSGREIREFTGDKNSWMSKFKAEPRLMTGIAGTAFTEI